MVLLLEIKILYFHDNDTFYETHACWWKVVMAIVHKPLKTVTNVLCIYYTLM